MPRPILRVLSATACAALIGTTATATTATATEPAAPSETANCATLQDRKIPAKGIGLTTRGATVTKATPLTTPATGTYCQVTGEIHPVDQSAPAIRFQVNLPTRWNHRSMLFGGGGANGTVVTGLGQVPAGPATGKTPLAQGYVTYGSDSGHQAGPATSRDGRFALNDEALRNFSGDALKKTHDVAMRLTTHPLRQPTALHVRRRRLDRRPRGAPRREPLAARLRRRPRPLPGVERRRPQPRLRPDDTATRQARRLPEPRQAHRPLPSRPPEVRRSRRSPRRRDLQPEALRPGLRSRNRTPRHRHASLPRRQGHRPELPLRRADPLLPHPRHAPAPALPPRERRAQLPRASRRGAPTSAASSPTPSRPRSSP